MAPSSLRTVRLRVDMSFQSDAWALDSPTSQELGDFPFGAVHARAAETSEMGDRRVCGELMGVS